MIYVIKALNEMKPYCVTANKQFALDVVEIERKDGNDLYFFECKNVDDVKLLVSDEYVDSVMMFFAIL